MGGGKAGSWPSAMKKNRVVGYQVEDPKNRAVGGLRGNGLGAGEGIAGKMIKNK